MDLTFQVPMQYCSLQHRIVLLSPVTSTTGCCFCFGSIPSFFLELFLHWYPVAYWAPTDPGNSSFNILSFCLFILFMGLEQYCSPFKTNTPKRCPFHYRGLECKIRKSGNTWSNRQIWPWSTERSRAKANRVLPGERTGHSKHPLPTTQEKTLHMDITSWSTLKSDWLYSLQPKMQKLYTDSKNKTGSWLWLRSWTPYCQIQT